MRRWCWRRKPVPLGLRGERAAARFLQRLGYAIVARGVRGPRGELDLVAVDRDVIVFVEVKTRRRASDEHPASAVDRTKQARLVDTAIWYLGQHQLHGYAFRFDIVAVIWPAATRQPTIHHLPHAFVPTDRGSVTR